MVVMKEKYILLKDTSLTDNEENNFKKDKDL